MPNRSCLLGLCLAHMTGIAPWNWPSGRFSEHLGNNNPGPVGGAKRSLIPTGIAWLGGPIRGIGVGVDSQFLKVGSP